MISSKRQSFARTPSLPGCTASTKSAVGQIQRHPRFYIASCYYMCMQKLFSNRCRNCDAPFQSAARNTRYCSPKCNIIHKTDKSSGCWIWTGAIYKQGYGNIRVSGKQVKVHRAAYEAFVGPADQLLVCHKCDVRQCCNPDHLFLGTHQDNYDDMIAKNRQPPTWRPPRTLEIMADTRPTKIVAGIHGISTRRVRKIRSMAR